MSVAHERIAVVSAIPSTRDLLDFEAGWKRHHGRKEEAIRAAFGMPPARYYQLLHRAIDTREALEHDPLLTRRLQRRLAADAARRGAQMGLPA